MSDNIKCGDMVYFRMINLDFESGIWKGQIITMGKLLCLMKVRGITAWGTFRTEVVSVPKFLIHGKVLNEN